MLTIEALQAFGADTKTGLSRCMNNESFYFRMIRMILTDKNFEKLSAALAEGDLETAFEAAHTLKGVLGNLSLTPLYSPVAELTEHLRARKDMDYSGYLQEISARFAALRALCED